MICFNSVDIILLVHTNTVLYLAVHLIMNELLLSQENRIKFVLL